jgi:hypothetical protein
LLVESDLETGTENRWLDSLEPDFFDLVLMDEARHNPAASWQQVKEKASAAQCC